MTPDLWNSEGSRSRGFEMGNPGFLTFIFQNVVQLCSLGTASLRGTATGRGAFWLVNKKVTVCFIHLLSSPELTEFHEFAIDNLKGGFTKHSRLKPPRASNSYYSKSNYEFYIFLKGHIIIERGKLMS